MVIQLNIGLERSGFENTPEEIACRVPLAVRAMSRAGKVLHWYICPPSYQPDNEFAEWTLIGVVSAYNAEPRNREDMKAMDLRMHSISEQLMQDCIAWRVPEINEGYLSGPRAKDWGPFEPKYFIGPSQYASKKSIHHPEEQ